jgi:hypothetical protein
MKLTKALAIVLKVANEVQYDIPEGDGPLAYAIFDSVR